MNLSQNSSQNKLKQIAKTRRIKNYKDMLKEDLLIAFLKDNNVEKRETKKSFNKLRNNFLKEAIKKIRRKFHFKESIDKYLKELEQKDSLTKQE